MRPAHSSRASRRRPARRSNAAAAGNRCGCEEARCHGRRRSGARNSMRRRTSSADQFASRSAGTASSAELKVPSGFARRGQMWPLSMWVCMSTKHGHTMPPSRSKRGSPVAVPAAVDALDLAGCDGDIGADQFARRRGVGGLSSRAAGKRGVGEHVAFARREWRRNRWPSISSPAGRRSRATSSEAGDEIRLVAKKITTPVKERRIRAANRRGMLRRNCDSSSRKARPESAPAEPAANSATTAAISARPPAILRPARK